MTTLIDIGNSRVKYCSLDEIDKGTFTKVTTVANEYFNESYFTEYFRHVNKIIVASVAPNLLTENLERWCLKQNLSYLEVKSEQKRANVISAYDQPEQLGVDRWLTLLGSAQIYPNKSVLIIDAGTATTIDLLSPSGQHIGGWILAGISTLFNSVLKETTKVSAKVVNHTSLSFGKNTTSNVNNACWAATVGLINQAITQAKYEVNHLDKIIITGGNAEVLQKLLSVDVTRIDELVFYGLNRYS